jgi:hypothetical protein
MFTLKKYISDIIVDNKTKLKAIEIQTHNAMTKRKQKTKIFNDRHIITEETKAWIT